MYKNVAFINLKIYLRDWGKIIGEKITHHINKYLEENKILLTNLKIPRKQNWRVV